MSARRGDSDKPEMVTLVDPDGEEFETGDLGTLHSLRANGYALKGKETYASAVEKLTPPPTATPTATPEPGSK